MSSRDILAVPDGPHVGLTTYDAKDPDITSEERLTIAMARQ